MLSRRMKLVYLGGALAISLYFCQEVLFKDAGKTVESKAYTYSFQLNYWGEVLHQRIDSIRDSGAASRLIIGESKVTVNKQFFIDLYAYQREMKDVLRVLHNQSQIPFLILEDLEKMTAYGFETEEEAEQLVTTWTRFEELLNEYKQRAERLDTYLPELSAAFSGDYEKMSEDEKVELTVKQIELLKELYSSELLFMKHSSDQLKFVRDFAEQSHHFLTVYEDVLRRYNNRVSSDESLKQIILSLLTLLSIVIAIRIEKESL